MLYENENWYLNILHSSDNTDILFGFNSTKLSSTVQPLISSTNKLDSSLIYVNPQMSLNTYLDLNFENKQQRLTNAININGIQLMVNTMSFKTISLKNTTSNGQISGGVLYENEKRIFKYSTKFR